MTNLTAYNLWCKYKALPEEDQSTINSVLCRKKKLSVDELIQHMKNKGITFNIINKDDAKHFLQKHNYYFKLAAYRANYAKYPHGNLKVKYISLDFAYLRELSTIDMHLRYVILKMCLDIEHQLKVMLLTDVESNLAEDGYSLVEDFDSNKSIRSKFLRQASGSYAQDLIQKHQDLLDFPIWAFCELISFGDFIKLYKFYIQRHPKRKTLPKFNLLYPIRNLRNAAAHSNCLIYKLSAHTGNTTSDIGNIISKIPTLTVSSREKYLKILPIHDFAVLLYWYSLYVTSEGLLHSRKRELYALFFHRMRMHKEYFLKSEYIQNSYVFCIRLIQYFFKNH